MKKMATEDRLLQGQSSDHGVCCSRGTTRNCGGFSLIEILVTTVILAIGLLGLAGLVVDGVRNNQGAYLRTQASILAYDMADRIRANADYARDADGYSGFSTEGSGVTLPGCAEDGCTPQQQVLLDKVEWTRQIEGAGGATAMLPSGEGSIVSPDPGLYTITISWSEVRREWEDGGDGGDSDSFSLTFSL